MKTILAPTDFSEAATNAVNYAAELANVTGAKLILLHAYHPPLITSDLPVVFPSLDEIADASLITLHKTELQLRNKFRNAFPVDCVVKCGFAAEETEWAAAEYHADLVVMGMRGAGFIEEKLVGSVTTSVLNRISAPILIIDSKLTYRKPQAIALATDLEGKIGNENIRRVKYFARLFDAKLHVVNVVRNEKVPELAEAVAGVNLSSSLQDVKHDFAVIESADVVDGLNKYTETNAIDIVIVFPRKHSLITRLFSPSTTKKMAFHAHAPLLCIHE